MKRFEYHLTGTGSAADAQESLTALGREGWQLVGIFGPQAKTLVLMREAAEAEKPAPRKSRGKKGKVG